MTSFTQFRLLDIGLFHLAQDESSIAVYMLNYLLIENPKSLHLLKKRIRVEKKSLASKEVLERK